MNERKKDRASESKLVDKKKKDDLGAVPPSRPATPKATEQRKTTKGNGK